MSSTRVGTCGFCLRQQEYYRTFEVVELQQTFYQPPRLATAQKWRAEAPEGFEFTLKAFQAITHPPGSPTYRRSRLNDAERSRCGGFQDTPVVRKAWKATLELARALDAKLVVFQCPASFRPTDENVANLIRFFQWAHRDRLRLGWEPRGEAWTDDLLRELCRELSLTHVVDPFQRACLRPRPPYFRLHGIGGYRHRYSGEELGRLRQECTAPLTYCMFNNASMGDDAGRYARMLGDGAEGA
jgi:uncharacterized protein YecE (DUF72 family)